MLEAVGEEYWPEFFAVCDRLLARGRGSALQTITMPARPLPWRRAAATRWVHKYIFPGGLIPSVRAIDRGTRARVAAASVLGHRDRPPLRPPRCRPGANGSSPASRRCVALGFDDTFRRTWEFYLAYCEAGFAARGDRRRPAGAGAPVKLGGSRVWITGASSGIGEALAAELAARGARVAISARRADAARTTGAAPRDGAGAAGRQRPRGGAGRGRHGPGRAGRDRRRDPECGVVRPHGCDRLGSRRLPPPRRGEPDGDRLRYRGGVAGHAQGAGRQHRGHGQRGRLPRPPVLAGVRPHEGGPDQPAGVAAHRPAAARHRGDDGLPRVRAHRSHRRQHLPDALDARARRGRAADRRRARQRQGRDRVPAGR